MNLQLIFYVNSIIFVFAKSVLITNNKDMKLVGHFWSLKCHSCRIASSDVLKENESAVCESRETKQALVEKPFLVIQVLAQASVNWAKFY